MIPVTANDVAPGNDFSNSVAIYGRWMIVGSPGSDFGSGAAYIFTWDGSTWNQHLKIIPNDRDWETSLAVTGII